MSNPIDWSTVALELAGDGITRQTVHGQASTTIRYVYPPGSRFQTHAHPEEQTTVVLTGTIIFWMNDTEVTAGPSATLVIPPNVPHGARVEGGETVVTINTLAPRRGQAPNA